MGRTRKILATLALLVAPSVGWDDPPGPPADFKIQVASFRLDPEPASTEEIIVRGGRAYVFPSDSREVLIVDPSEKCIELLDVGRRVQCELSDRSLDAALTKIRAKLRDAVEGLEKAGGRANLVEAKMTRDLFETKLAVAEGPGSGRVRLTNPAVEVEARGEPEADAQRLAMVAATLNGIARLGAFRSPDDLPPFVELEAIAALSGERRLRPTELTYLYRLAGPPRKFRRTYRLVPSLTGREVEAISRVDRLRESAPVLRYERYRMAK